MKEPFKAVMCALLLAMGHSLITLTNFLPNIDLLSTYTLDLTL
jgi:hypothetical protein